MRPTIASDLFERKGDRWDTDAPSAKDPVVAALRDFADKRKPERGYDAGPVRKPRYDGAAMHPHAQCRLAYKPLGLVSKETMKGIRAREYQSGCGGSYARRELVLKVEPDLVKLTQDQLEARVQAGRDWVAEERARIANMNKK